MPKNLPPNIEEVTAAFGKAHTEEAKAKSRMEKYKKQFYDLLKVNIPKSQLAQQTIYYEGSDPNQYVAALYPKWEIVKKEVTNLDGEWRIIIREDPTKKSYTYLNRTDGMVYQRTVAESAPEIDMEQLQVDHPKVYEAITYQPDPPPRALKPLEDLEDEQKEILKAYLLPPKLTNRMDKPRPAKPEELEENE